MKICRHCAKKAGVSRINDILKLECDYCPCCGEIRGIRPFKGKLPERMRHAIDNNEPRKGTAAIPERGTKPS